MFKFVNFWQNWLFWDILLFQVRHGSSSFIIQISKMVFHNFSVGLLLFEKIIFPHSSVATAAIHHDTSLFSWRRRYKLLVCSDWYEATFNFSEEISCMIFVDDTRNKKAASFFAYSSWILLFQKQLLLIADSENESIMMCFNSSSYQS